ncbi:unnamed protein product, partial [Brassica napus]
FQILVEPTSEWIARISSCGATIAELVHERVNEVMEDIENAGNQYSKAVRLLVFLLVEAPMLILNPPSFLTNSDRYRLSRRLKPSAITKKKLRFSGVIISHDELTTITIYSVWLLLFLLLFFFSYLKQRKM